MSRYDGMRRETMLATVTGYIDDEANKKKTDRATAVDEFMKDAGDSFKHLDEEERERTMSERRTRRTLVC